MTKKLLGLYGLKWNPFAPDVPVEALHRTARMDSFVFRVEHLVRDGGFAQVLGDVGCGKSVTLRVLRERLLQLRDVVCGVLERPQAGLSDFYREMGHHFGVPLRPHNRWAGAHALRKTWQAHLESAGFRPVLLIDEAQEVRPDVLSELRLLSSAELDARALLTVVLCGDRRLQEKLRLPELLPLDSRLRVRLLLDGVSPGDLADCLRHVLAQAGAPHLMTAELIQTLCEHAAGNYRALMTMAHELLLCGAQREVHKLDEKLFFDLFTPAAERPRGKSARR